MALVFRAVIGQLEIPRPLVGERPVDQPDVHQGFQRPIDCDFVQGAQGQLLGDLVLPKRSGRLHQDLQNGEPGLRAVEPRVFQHLPGFIP
jgi:hypothetical protein